MTPARAPVSADADGDLVDELLGQVVDAGPLEERQRRVAADEAGARDDVDAGLGGQGLVVVDVAPVADAGGVDEGAAAVLVEQAELGDGLLVPLLRRLPPAGVELAAGHAVADVLVDRDDPELLGRDRHPGRCSHVAWRSPSVSRSRGLSTRIRWRSSSLSPCALQERDERRQHVGVGDVSLRQALGDADRIARQQDPVAVAGVDRGWPREPRARRRSGRAASSLTPTWSMATYAPTRTTSSGTPAATASARSTPPTTTRSAGTPSSSTTSRSCIASAPNRMDTGMPVASGGARRTTEEALVSGGHARSRWPR